MKIFYPYKMTSLRHYFITVVLVTVIGVTYYSLQPCDIISIEDISERVEDISEKVTAIPERVENISEKVTAIPENIVDVTEKIEDITEYVQIEDTQDLTFDEDRLPIPRQWLGCPKLDDGLNSIIVTSYFHGRLGNYIWEYLSAWAVARRYGIFPTVERRILNELNIVFEDLSIPCLEEVAERCGFMDQLENIKNTSNGINDLQSMLIHIENPTPGRFKYMVLPVYGVLTEEILPWWRQLNKEMRIQVNLRERAQYVLHLVDKEARTRTRISERIPFEFVGVHVRRTDYLTHVVNNYPGAKAADERFFLHAMDWLRTQLQRPLAFVVVSDDLNWCRSKLSNTDVFIVGNGNETNPGEDLALLAACNYTIFAYGTYGLSAAMLANGRYTLLYDTQNNSYTKEMEFAPFIPGWHILDDEGKQNYSPAQRDFGFSFYLR